VPTRSSRAIACGLACFAVMAWESFAVMQAGAAAETARFDFRALQALVQERPEYTIDELLEALPISYRAHYVLVFSSRSLQQASLRDPRAILYGGDAHLMVSFNGSASQRGYEALETAEYDPDTARFQFREIKPLPSGANGSLLQVSEVDPVRCRLCHGTPPRPLWDGTPFWPSVYGERYRSNLSAKERAGLATFLLQQPSHARYRSLPNAERLAYRGTFAPEAKSEYDNTGQEAPNAEFSRLLGGLNIQMIARELRRAPNYEAYRYALLGVMENGCGGPADFLPSSSRAVVAAGFRSFAVKTADADEQRDESKRRRALDRSSGGVRSPVSLAASDEVTAVRFIAEYALGIHTDGWNLTFEKGGSDFRIAPEDGAALADIMRTEVARGDPKVGERASLGDYSSGDAYCRYLSERSRAAIAAIDSAVP